jgi:2-dehydro-3-deoxygalactonokinase
MEERSFPRGILSVRPGEFGHVFHYCFSDWLTRGLVRRVLISGMAGSKQGWREAPYCPCPAGFADVAAQVVPVQDPTLQLPVAIVPGLSCEHAGPQQARVPDVMRGEEVQIFGAMLRGNLQDGLFVLPGTHNKWARVQAGQVQDFRTTMTGEFYALLSQQSLLAKSLDAEAPFDEGAFLRGLAQAAQGAGLLHNAFTTRSLGLFDRQPAAAAASYLSGLLLGEELRAQPLPRGSRVVLIAMPRSRNATRWHWPGRGWRPPHSAQKPPGPVCTHSPSVLEATPRQPPRR